MPAQRKHDPTRLSQTSKRSPKQERDRYLRRLYLLLSLIVILLFVIILLIPDGRSDVAEDARYVGSPEPQWEDAPAAGEAPSAGDEGQSDGDEGQSDGADVSRSDPHASAGGGEPSPEALPDPDSSPREPSELPERESPPGEPSEPPDVQESLDVREPHDRQGAYTGTLYFVLDDVGYNISELEPFLDLGIPLTIAVLPHLDFSREAVARARNAGLDVILHLPMEPTIDVDPGPGAILTDQSRAEMRRRVNGAIESVPGVIGANNHMGSAATADPRVMRTVIDELASNGLFFLDSRTSAESQVEVVSGRLELPYVRRDIFVDHDRDEDAMRRALSRGIERASEHGVAIVIGHVQTPALPAIIEEAEREAARRGVRFDGLSHYRDTVFLAHRGGLDNDRETGR